MRSTKELNEAIGSAAAAAAGLVRRMAVTLTGTATAARLLWQVTGVRMLDGKQEIQTVEMFGGIGIAARPPTSGKPEVIVIGAAESAVAIAARDAKTQQATAGALKVDETALFNSQALVYVKDNGTIEARTAAGAAVPLALKSDVQAVVDWLKKHVHTGITAGGANSGPPANGVVDGTAPANPTGTTCLKGQ